MKLNRVSVGLGGGKLYQFANRTHAQMMSYLIETPDGSLIMIDGGYPVPEQAKHLYELLKEHGGRVDSWIMTHAHDDHFGTLLWMLENIPDFDIEIDKLLYDFPPMEWIESVEKGLMVPFVTRFYNEIERHKIKTLTLKEGDVLKIGGMSLDILSDASDYSLYPEINDTSVIIKAHFPENDVLFLGDLGFRASENLAEKCGDKLRCDIVQMAHHGQNGAGLKFYKRVMPKICLYTAPDWLWDNDNGGGKGSGPWRTLETREWMEQLGVKESCPIAYGDYIFE